MKKLLLTMAVVALAFSANAQVYIGGSASWTNSKAKNIYLIKPEVGYVIDGDWSIGLAGGYGYDANTKMSGFSLEPYARFGFFREGILTMFIEAGGGYAWSRVKGQDHEDGYTFGFKPGMALRIGNHVSFIAHYGFLGYREDYYGSNRSGLDFSTESLSIGFNYVF